MMKKKIIFLMLIFCFMGISLSAQTPRIISAASIALRGEPKYQDGFTHFDYVNPDAPKGGNITLHVIGTYDSFHRYALRGDSLLGPPTGFYDTLLVSSWDEVESYYPLIAERIEYAEDFSFIIFHINPDAKAQDGVPITSEDVVFSFNTFYEKGVPQFKRYYEGVTAQALDTLRVRFDLPRPDDKELMMAICGINILPKHFWETRDFSEPLSVPPLGTGPYRKITRWVSMLFTSVCLIIGLPIFRAGKAPSILTVSAKIITVTLPSQWKLLRRASMMYVLKTRP